MAVTQTWFVKAGSNPYPGLCPVSAGQRILDLLVLGTDLPHSARTDGAKTTLDQHPRRGNPRCNITDTPEHEDATCLPTNESTSKCLIEPTPYLLRPPPPTPRAKYLDAMTQVPAKPLVRIQQLEIHIARVLRRVGSTMDLPQVVFVFAGLNGSGTATLSNPASVAGGDPIGSADSGYRRLDADQLPMSSLLELRHLKSAPGTGAWFSVVVQVWEEGEAGGAGDAGDYSFTYNYDRRIYYNSSAPEMDVPPEHSAPDPTNQEYLDDLRRYPRDARSLPAWYPRMPTTAAMQVPVLDVATTMTSPVERSALSAEAALFPVELSVLTASAAWVRVARAVKVHTIAVLAANNPRWEHDGDNEWVSTMIFHLVYDEKLAGATAGGVKTLWHPGGQFFPDRITDHIEDAELVSAPSADLEALLEDVCDVIGDLVNHRLAAAAGWLD